MSVISHFEWLLIFVFFGGFLVAMFDEETAYRLVGMGIMIVVLFWVMTRL